MDPNILNATLYQPSLQGDIYLFDFLGRFIGPLIGALVGVFLGFWINERHKRKLENHRREFFKNLLNHEIDRSIELLEKKDLTNIIHIDGWKSLVNSGDIALFTHLVTQLSDIYFDIQNYNYEANWIWEHHFSFDEGGDVADQPRPLYLDGWAKQILEKLRAIKKELNELD